MYGKKGLCRDEVTIVKQSKKNLDRRRNRAEGLIFSKGV